jgi:hypothetical protein
MEFKKELCNKSQTLNSELQNTYRYYDDFLMLHVSLGKLESWGEFKFKVHHINK